jgi:heme/copper-type cytochrome/quinol oxidase subunit 1
LKPRRRGGYGEILVNWEAIGAIGEVVGAIGVILTLAYLAYQIRQNTIQLEQNTMTARASAQTASNVTLRENRQSIFETKDMAEIFEKGNANPEQLDSTQLLRYRLLMQNVTEVMLEIYTQAFVTEFSPETWETQGRTLVIRVFNTAGGKWFWGQFQDNYPQNFRNQVDLILSELSEKDSE